MAISDEAVRKLTLGKDVEQVITDCFQDWEGALEWALDHLPDPPESTSMLEWSISLIGNMLWACTVFFPPAFVTGELIVATSRVVDPSRLAGRAVHVVQEFQQATFPSASAATKVCSLLGAAIGSSSAQIGGVLRMVEGKLDMPSAKKYFHGFFLRQVGPATEEFVNRADKWAKQDLLNHIIMQFSIAKKPDPKANNDEEFLSYYNSAVASHLLRAYVWEKFVFPSPELTFAKQKLGLEDFLSKVLEDLVSDYEKQWADYKRPDWERGSELPHRKGEEFRSSLPPFKPVFKFNGMPQDVLSLHETNRAKLLGSTGSL